MVQTLSLDPLTVQQTDGFSSRAVQGGATIPVLTVEFSNSNAEDITLSSVSVSTSGSGSGVFFRSLGVYSDTTAQTSVSTGILTNVPNTGGRYIFPLSLTVKANSSASITFIGTVVSSGVPISGILHFVDFTVDSSIAFTHQTAPFDMQSSEIGLISPALLASFAAVPDNTAGIVLPGYTFTLGTYHITGTG